MREALLTTSRHHASALRQLANQVSKQPVSDKYKLFLKELLFLRFRLAALLALFEEKVGKDVAEYKIAKGSILGLEHFAVVAQFQAEELVLFESTVCSCCGVGGIFDPKNQVTHKEDWDALTFRLELEHMWCRLAPFFLFAVPACFFAVYLMLN